MIDGAVFDDPDTCYLGVFKNTGALDAATTVYTGTLFLQKYYTIFDMSGCDGTTCSKMRVGVGKRNLTSNILQPLYNDSASTYNATDHGIQRNLDQSHWTYQPNDF